MRKIKDKVKYPSQEWHLYNLSTTKEVMEESKQMFFEFVDKYKLNKIAIKNWGYFSNRYEKAPALENGRIFDHMRMFKNKDNELLCITHPYKNGDLNKDIITITDWCEQRGLKATIHCDSWYFPGRCYCIVFSKER